MLSTLFASQSTTFVLLYNIFSNSTIAALLPPELAVSWVLTKLTKRVRQPVNIAVAAGVVKLVPSITSLEITPIMTGFTFTGDKKTTSEGMAKVEEFKKKSPVIKNVFENGAKLFKWVQGKVRTKVVAFSLFLFFFRGTYDPFYLFF